MNDIAAIQESYRLVERYSHRDDHECAQNGKEQFLGVVHSQVGPTDISSLNKG